MANKYLYAITAISDNGFCYIYIGESKNIFKRWKQHQTALKYGRHHCFKLQEIYYTGLPMYYDQLLGFDGLSEKDAIKHFDELENYEVLNTLHSSSSSDYYKQVFQNHPARSEAITRANLDRWKSEGYRERVAYDHKRPDLVAKQRATHPGKPFDLFYKGEHIGSYDNLRDACDAHGLDSGNLSCVLNGKAKQTKGYTGRYKYPD